MKTKLFGPLAVFAILATIPTASLAGDGVVEINQVRALAGGVTPGDSAGFPVTLSEHGSYVLTGNLNAGPSVGIEITAPDVTVDLNGFKLAGTLVGDSAGIRSTFVGTRVHDGVVQLFGGPGIDLTDRAIVENVRVADCSGNGIRVGDDSVVRNCQVLGNQSRGIWTGFNAVVSGNISQGGLIGIRVDGGVVRDNAVEGDGDTGIQASGRSTIIVNNTVNGALVNGIVMGPGVGYVGNVVAGANTDVHSGVQLGSNVCGTGLCP